MPWVEIQIKVAEPLKDAVISRLFELGATGVDESKLLQAQLLSAYFEQTAGANAFQELNLFTKSLGEIHPTLPSVTAEMIAVKEENWNDRYKEFYRAQKLTSLFYLTPAWDKTAKVPDEMIPIIMEPGQAFGTGLHQSTKLSMLLIEQALELFAVPDEVRLLDVGTGTGILAISAWKLGVRQVLAIDNDPLAVEAAQDNIRLNHCDGVEVSGELLNMLEKKNQFDVIVSNILLETHAELGSEYRRLLAPKGHLILAGVLGQQKDDLNRMMAKLGFIAEATESLQEWSAVRYVTHG